MLNIMYLYLILCEVNFGFLICDIKSNFILFYFFVKWLDLNLLLLLVIIW